MFVLVTYDTPEEKRRKKFRKICKDYGTWVQYSVYECILTKKQLNKLRKELKSIICETEDSIRYYCLDKMREGDNVIIDGTGEATILHPVLIL